MRRQTCRPWRSKRRRSPGGGAASASKTRSKPPTPERSRIRRWTSPHRWWCRLRLRSSCRRAGPGAPPLEPSVADVPVHDTALNPVAVKVQPAAESTQVAEPSSRSPGPTNRGRRSAGRSRRRGWPERGRRRGRRDRGRGERGSPPTASLRRPRTPTTPTAAKPPAEAGAVFAEVLSGAFDAETEAAGSGAAEARAAPRARGAEAAEGAGAGRHRFAPRHGRTDPRWPHHRQRRAGAHRPAHLVRRPGQGQRQAGAAAHRAAAAAADRLSQAGRRDRHARRSAASADGVPPAAAAAAGQVAVGRPARHQHRRPAAVHQLRRPGQPADAPALRRRA